MKEYLAETASQTAGPYVHIGLAPDAAGFHIFEKISVRSSPRRIPKASALLSKAG
jgi:protocatechuate 3,4-dioxygenase beta subunit